MHNLQEFRKYNSLNTKSHSQLMEQQWMKYESLTNQINGQQIFKTESDSYINQQSTTEPSQTHYRKAQSIILDQESSNALVYLDFQERTSIDLIRSQVILPNTHSDICSIDDLNKQKAQRNSMQFNSFLCNQDTKYKTELCNNWQQTGKCNYGKKCQFAHGREELHTNPTMFENYKYKSKMCKSYHQYQICPYGTRCQFLHEYRLIDEFRGLNHYQKLLESFVLDQTHQIKRSIVLHQLARSDKPFDEVWNSSLFMNNLDEESI